MNGLKKIIIIFLLAIGMFNCTVQAKPASVLLQEGLYAEEVEGDLDAAIKIYEQIITDDSAQRSHVAQALYRQGMCYYKKRDEQKARAVLSKLVTDFSDHTDLVKKAKPLLDDLTNADPAALMPPETLVYIELGSPGGQIETILNMLKGTPLENPLAIIGGGLGSKGPKQMNEWKSPADMMGALLNPSMIAEFKKIRGAGIGVTGVSPNEPPALMILYPGKSDALRGLLLATLGMVGRPAEAVEGMQSVALPEGAGAAYDDTIIILATAKAVSAGQLSWCVKQYKGITNEPTLASSNKSFAKVNKKSRLENALTIWANVDQVFANLSNILPKDEITKEIQMANNFVDFQNVDDLIASFSINESGVTLETNINFIEGHNCLAYDLIRTPNLSKAGFEAVPPEAIALISHALGETETTQANVAGQKIVNLTGLDIGRELFANIEQITFFALDPDSVSAQGNSWMPPIASCLGLAITSQNPQQTRQILTRLLTIANLVTTQSADVQIEQGTGRYQIGLVSGQQLFCYMDQGNKTTVLSLNSDVIEASIAAINNHSSVSSAGSLKDAVGKLSPTTSKLVLLNIGGLIKLAGANIDLGPVDAADETNKLIAQLAEAFDGTIARLLTDEQINNLSIRASISGLPAVNEVFVPIMQLVQILEKSKSKAKAKMAAPASIKKTDKAPVIDGQAEDLWSQAQKYRISNQIYSPVSSPEDLSANYRVLWDNENLYLLVDVIDDELVNDSEEFYYDDTIEVFIDADNSKDGSYGDNDYTYNICWDETSPSFEERGQAYNNDDIKYALVMTDNGYRLEMKFPWLTLGAKPSPGAKIGLDVHVNDDDDGGERDTKFTWSDTDDDAFQNTRAFGTAELAGQVGWWKLDENQGEEVSDSSGNNNNGSLVGDPQWKPSGGILGGALEFDGDGDYVEIENESNFDFAGQVTVAAWVNITSIPMEWTAIVTKGDSAWRLSTERDERRFHFAVDAGTYISGQKVVNADEWHHVAGVYDGSQMRLYVDGQLDASGSHKGRIGRNDHTVYIGENAEQTGRFWHGLIDDVRIYNYALPQHEIQAFGSIKAAGPQPGNGAIVGSEANVKLSWVPGIATNGQKLFFGTNPDALKSLGNVTNSNYTDLPNLKNNSTYYWRVDKVLENDDVVSGDLWSFTTGGKLIGHWKLDETSGTVAKDSSGNGNDGAIQDGSVLQPEGGKIAGAVKFDGYSPHIEIPTVGMSASKGTVALWVKLSENQELSDHRYIFGHTTEPYYSNRIQLYMDSNITMLDLGLGDEHEVNQDMATLEVGKWYQIALTWDDGTYVVYLNGEELANGGYSGLEDINNTADIGNNGRPGDREQPFNGLIDDVRIYNYNLSKNEVKALYNGVK